MSGTGMVNGLRGHCALVLTYHMQPYLLWHVMPGRVGLLCCASGLCSRSRRCAVLNERMVLCDGADLVCGARRCARMVLPDASCEPEPAGIEVRYHPTCYPMPGTDIAYAAITLRNCYPMP
eukprot:1592810-Rhodomonas_salina.1